MRVPLPKKNHVYISSRLKFTIIITFKILGTICTKCKGFSFFHGTCRQIFPKRTFGYVSTYRTSLLCRRKLSIDALAPLHMYTPSQLSASLSLVPSFVLLPFPMSASLPLSSSSLSLLLLLPLSLVFLYTLPPA